MGHVEAALGAFASVLRAGSGALSLCSVAAGWADCTIGSSANSWDVAAAMLIVEKAGATYVPTYYGDDDPTAGPQYATGWGALGPGASYPEYDAIADTIGSR